MKRMQDKENDGRTYQERFRREWEQATQNLKRSGADLGRIGIAGVERVNRKKASVGR